MRQSPLDHDCTEHNAPQRRRHPVPLGWTPTSPGGVWRALTFGREQVFKRGGNCFHSRVLTCHRRLVLHHCLHATGSRFVVVVVHGIPETNKIPRLPRPRVYRKSPKPRTPFSAHDHRPIARTVRNLLRNTRAAVVVLHDSAPIVGAVRKEMIYEWGKKK